MSTPGKNAKKRAKRQQLAKPPRTRDEVDDPVFAMLEAAHKVDVDAGHVYPQPTRCTNCGAWCYVLAYLSDKVCGSDCARAKEARRATKP